MIPQAAHQRGGGRTHLYAGGGTAEGKSGQCGDEAGDELAGKDGEPDVAREVQAAGDGEFGLGDAAAGDEGESLYHETQQARREHDDAQPENGLPPVFLPSGQVAGDEGGGSVEAEAERTDDRPGNYADDRSFQSCQQTIHPVHPAFSVSMQASLPDDSGSVLILGHPAWLCKREGVQGGPPDPCD